MNTKLFRQVSIERLSSPEQLDAVLRVTSFRSWLALAATFGVLAVAVAWGYTGSIPTTATGQGLIVRHGGVLNLVARGAGVVVEMRVKAGERIHANQVVAIIAQPELVEKLKAMRGAFEDAKRQRLQTLQVQQNAAKLQIDALNRDRLTIQVQIDDLNGRSKIATEQIASEEQLLAKGLVTKQQVIAARQSVATLQQQIQSLQVKLKQMDAEQYTIQAQPAQSDLPLQANIASVERELAALQHELSFAEQVVAPDSGEVLEAKVFQGSAVAPGQPLVSVQPDASILELVGYLPASQAKDARQGFEVQVSPSNIKREEFGFMTGEVTYIADYPSTPEALMRNFQNLSLVNALSQPGPVTEIHASLRTSPDTFSGFEWSTSKGPQTKISAGMICSVQIVTKREKPLNLLFPYVKKKVGIS
jgi:HlyD family secretion protein